MIKMDTLFLIMSGKEEKEEMHGLIVLEKLMIKMQLIRLLRILRIVVEDLNLYTNMVKVKMESSKMILKSKVKITREEE